ncbi:MAG: hypothetical protein JWN48_3982 [Myxococcaceae bacterium]|nr:hypothetical protein [Myxococcaceae bacterium]
MPSALSLELITCHGQRPQCVATVRRPSRQVQCAHVSMRAWPIQRVVAWPADTGDRGAVHVGNSAAKSGHLRRADFWTRSFGQAGDLSLGRGECDHRRGAWCVERARWAAALSLLRSHGVAGRHDRDGRWYAARVCSASRPNVPRRHSGEPSARMVPFQHCLRPRCSGRHRAVAWGSSSCLSRMQSSVKAVAAAAATSTVQRSAWQASASRAVKLAMPTATATSAMVVRRRAPTVWNIAVGAICSARRRAAVRSVRVASAHRPVCPGAQAIAMAIPEMAVRRT